MRTPSNAPRFVVACVVMIASLLPSRAEPLAQQVPADTIPLPLPMVTRTRPPGANPFERAPIVVLARIWQRAEVEDGGFEGQSLNPIRYWTYVKAKLLEVVRLNERKVDDPDLGNGYLLVEQIERMEKPIPFGFGKEYLLLLAPSQDYRFEWRSPDEAPYVLAVPQGGFEVTKGRLVPLIDGGELDQFEGKLLVDVVKNLRKQN